MADGFWENAEAAQRQMKKIKDLQKWIADYTELEGAVDELKLALDKSIGTSISVMQQDEKLGHPILSGYES